MAAMTSCAYALQMSPNVNAEILINIYLKSDKFTSYLRLIIPFDINYIKTGKTFGR